MLRTSRAVAGLPVSAGRVALNSMLLIAFVGGVACMATLQSAHRYVMGYQIEFVGLVLRKSPVGLVFPALAVVPYTLAVVPVVRERFLVYTRTRCALRRTLRQMYVQAAVVTGLVFAVLMLVYIAGAALSAPLGMADYRPDRVSYGPDEVTTFAQLQTHGTWVYYAFLCVWFGVNAASYAVLGLSLVLVIRQPAVALLLPWIVFIVAGFGMAVLGWEAFSPLTITPFNLTQLPMWMPLVPAVVIALAAVTSAVLVTTHRDRLAVVA